MSTIKPTTLLRNSSRTCFVPLLIFIASVLPGTAAYSQKWEELRNCSLVKSDSNDGDSFKILHKGKELIIRLYLVDTPETNLLYPNRNIEQMNAFESTLEKTIACGFLATEITQKLLDKPFTVITKGEDAKGSSKLGRQYGIVYTSNRTDLGQVLLEHGLARSHGQTPNATDSIDSKHSRKYDKLQSKYDQISQRAKRKNLGAWGKGDIKLSNSLTPNTNTSSTNRIGEKDKEKAIEGAQEIITGKEKEQSKISDAIYKTPTEERADKKNTEDQQEYKRGPNSIFPSSINRTLDLHLELNKVGNQPKKEEEKPKDDTSDLDLIALANSIKNNTNVLNAIKFTGLDKNDIEVSIEIVHGLSQQKSPYPSFLGSLSANNKTLVCLQLKSREFPLNKREEEMISKPIIEVFQEINYYYFESENQKVISRLYLQEAELWEKLKTKELELMASISTQSKIESKEREIENIIIKLKDQSTKNLVESKVSKNKFFELSGIDIDESRKWAKNKSQILRRNLGSVADQSINNAPNLQDLLNDKHFQKTPEEIDDIKKQRIYLNKTILKARQKRLETIQAHENLRAYQPNMDQENYSMGTVGTLIKNIDLLSAQREEFEAKALATSMLARLNAPVESIKFEH